MQDLIAHWWRDTLADDLLPLYLAGLWLAYLVPLSGWIILQ